MKIKEIKTEKLTKGILENYIRNCCNEIIFYGKLNNKLFIMKDQNTEVFDLKKQNFVISNIPGIAYPTVDNNKNNYYLIITPIYENKIHYNNYNQPRYSDTSRCLMYDMEPRYHDLECYCNIFDESFQNIEPINSRATNIYQFNSMLDGNKEYPNITYREINEDHFYFHDDDTYTTYPNLPSRINESFQKILSLYSFEEKQTKKDNSNLEIIYKKGKYIIKDNTKDLSIIFENNIKIIEIIDNNTIMLKNNDDKKALYDINKGYIINFQDNIKFDKAYKLNNNIFKLSIDKKHKLFINNNILEKTYNDISITKDNIIIAENFKNIDLYNTEGKLIYNIKNNYFYKCNDDIFYNEEFKFYHYNLTTNTKTEINILSLFKLEDGTKVNLSIDEALQNYKDYYYDRDTDEFILFKEKNYGIELNLLDNIKSKRWFNSKEKRKSYLELLLDSLINIKVTDKLDNSECNKKVKKLNKK